MTAKALVIVLMLLYIVNPCAASAENAETDSLQYLELELKNDGYHITGYVGKPEKLVIPSEIHGIDVIDIGPSAFSRCETLKEVWIGDGIDISEKAFQMCYYLETIRLPSDLTRIPYYAFNVCSSLKQVTIPEGVTYISEGGFRYCYGLESIRLPDSMEEVGPHAFDDCCSMVSLELNDSLEVIGWGAFFSCGKLRNVIIPPNVRRIGVHAFAHCNLENLYIPDSVTGIDDNAFHDGNTLFCVKGSQADTNSSLKYYRREYVNPEFFLTLSDSASDTIEQSDVCVEETTYVEWLGITVEASVTPQEEISLFVLPDWGNPENIGNARMGINTDENVIASKAGKGGEAEEYLPGQSQQNNDIEKRVIYGSSFGYGGEVIVAVVFEEDQIADVYVESSYESKETGIPAMQEICRRIQIEGNTEVDNVSGATISSKAVKKAVKDAVKKSNKGG